MKESNIPSIIQFLMPGIYSCVWELQSSYKINIQIMDVKTKNKKINIKLKIKGIRKHIPMLQITYKEIIDNSYMKVTGEKLWVFMQTFEEKYLKTGEQK